MRDNMDVVTTDRNALSIRPPLLIRGLGAVAVLGGIGVAWPLIVNAFMGGMTLVGIGFVSLVAAIGAKFVPALLQNAENLALETRKKAARWRPVEQLQNNYIKGCLSRDKKKAELTEYLTSIENMKDTLKKNIADFPDQDWSETESMIAICESDYAEEEQKLAQLETDLEASNKTIKIWERKLQTAEQIAAMKKPGDTKEEIILNMLNDAAAVEISTRLNRSMAAISVDKGLRERKALMQANGEKKIIDGAM